MYNPKDYFQKFIDENQYQIGFEEYLEFEDENAPKPFEMEMEEEVPETDEETSEDGEDLESPEMEMKEEVPETDEENSEDNGQSFEDTTIISTSDSEPIENPNIPPLVQDGFDLDKLDFSSKYTNPNGMGSNDQYSGTEGVNTFEYNLLLNAKPEIITAKTEPDGRINWQKITNQNDNYHDHWVEGIGNDTINNFSGSGGDGDAIDISGHTVSLLVLEESDSQVVLGVYSDQSQDNFRAGGAHDLDVLGTITVNHDGNFNLGSDVKVDPTVFDGVREFA